MVSNLSFVITILINAQFFFFSFHTNKSNSKKNRKSTNRECYFFIQERMFPSRLRESA